MSGSSAYAGGVFDQTTLLEIGFGCGKGICRDPEVFLYCLIVPEEVGLLEAAVETAEVDIKKHGDPPDLAGLAEFEEAVLEELIALHFNTSLTPELVVGGVL